MGYFYTPEIETLTSHLQLALEVNLPGLLEDLATCLSAEWRPHFNTRDYEGGWDSISLRSQDGQSTTVFAHPDRAYQDTTLLRACPHFQALLACLECEKESVRLLRQAAGGAIKTHRDHGLHYGDGVFRLHVPLVTNADVDFVVAGHRLVMEPGECWFADFSEPHSVVNRGATERIHLVVDCIRNPWTDAWFARAGFTGQVKPPAMDERRRQDILTSLRSQTAPAAAALIAQLEAESAAFVQGERVATMLGFLDAIGIPWREASLPDTTFLPGLEVVNGTVVIDREQLRYPGDILHEAGHIALLPAEKRALFSGNVLEALPEERGHELGVILWTYAAALHLDVPLDFVIHDDGYHESASWLREQLTSGTYLGLPLLVWMGLCEEHSKGRGFPQMTKWLR